MRKILACAAVVVAFVISGFLSTSLFPVFAEPKPGLAGGKECVGCHEEVFKNLGQTQMGRLFLNHPRNSTEELACETCHGPSLEHSESQGESFEGMIRFAKGSSTPALKRNEACLQCHERKNLLFWQGGPHEARDVTCSDCHDVHTNVNNMSNRKLLAKPTAMDTCRECHKQQVAQQMRFSHHPLREGKMDCTSCHNPHGSPSLKLLKTNYTADLCYSCHAEKRGPFVFEHPPVREDCSTCHEPHGTNYPRLQKLPEIRQCRQCHSQFHQLNFGGVGRQAAPHVLGRACSDCHVSIHGSNHPNGQFLTR